MQAASQLADKAPPRSDAFPHLKAVAESMQSLTWVAYTGKECGESGWCTQARSAVRVGGVHTHRV